MVLDAYKRRAPQYWYPIIMLVPLGGVAYLMLVKLKDVDIRDIGKVFQGPPRVPELRRRYRNTPSVAHLVALAQGLYDAGEYRESVIRFEEVLVKDKANHEALHGVGFPLSSSTTSTG